MLKVNGAAMVKGPYTVCLPLTEAEYEAMSTEGARALISEAIKAQTHRSVQVSHVHIYDYEEIEEINALQAINHYLVKGDRVDGVLHHIVTSEINRLQEMLEGNDGMSVREIRAQFVDLHRQLLAAQRKIESLEREQND